MTTFTKESKPITVYTFEERAGEYGNATWDDAVALWNDTTNYWDELLSATTFTKESKPITIFTFEAKP